MNIRQMVLEAMSTAGMPAWFAAYVATEEWPEPPPRYVVFTLMTVPSGYEDDGITEWAHYAYLEMWSDDDGYRQKRDAVRDAMMAAGFAPDGCLEGYEPSTKNYHLSMAFVIHEEVA